MGITGTFEDRKILPAPDTQEFFRSAIHSIESLTDSIERLRVYSRVVESPAFPTWLVAKDSMSPDERMRICRRLSDVDPLFDVKLAQMIAGMGTENSDLTLQLLEILDQISPSGRLVMKLSRLMHHPDPRVVSKAALLLGRRIASQSWVERHLAVQDRRTRANVVEALWGVDSPYVRQILEACLNDSNNRVVGNALVGLHRLGDSSVPDKLGQMLADTRASFRITAVWAMAKIGLPEFREPLQQALEDSDQRVQAAARAALSVLSSIKSNDYEDEDDDS